MNAFSRLVAVVCLVLWSAGADAQQARPTFDGKVVLFGNLHSHSALSDDIAHGTHGVPPLEGFKYADDHGLDFLAISDHHKPPGSEHGLRLTDDEYENQLFKVAMDYNAAHPGLFVAIPAIE